MSDVITSEMQPNRPELELAVVIPPEELERLTEDFVVAL